MYRNETSERFQQQLQLTKLAINETSEWSHRELLILM